MLERIIAEDFQSDISWMFSVFRTYSRIDLREIDQIDGRRILLKSCTRNNHG